MKLKQSKADQKVMIMDGLLYNNDIIFGYLRSFDVMIVSFYRMPGISMIFKLPLVKIFAKCF